MAQSSRVRLWQALTAFFALLALAAGAIALHLWRQRPQPVAAAAEEAPLEPEEIPDRLLLRPATFGELPGWGDDATAAALPPFLASCAALSRQPAEAPVVPLPAGDGAGGVGGTVADWRPICRRARALPRGDDAAARAFIERELAPLAVTNRGRDEGLFTGYFEPTLHGSRRRRGPYTVPLYVRPPELVTVDLGRFREDLAGRRIAGRLEGSRLLPYPDRQTIDAGALTGRGLELVWVDDPIGAFFLHIQGSGRIELAEGGHLRVGYAAQNGHPYFAIGRELVNRGELALEEVSLQSIRGWLLAHPDEAARVMAANPSYVFFRELSAPGPVGSQGVVLTPGRSLAVDATFLPLGAPLWLDTLAPDPDPGAPDRPLRRLMIAQDTGGAIRGPVRGDVFWGPGDEAAQVAGRMKHPGRLWLLVPRAVVPAP